MQIADQRVVTIDYTLTDERGEVLDSSNGEEPLTYIHGTGNIVPGLETALMGKSAGDSVKITIPAADGYGERDEELVQDVPRDRFPGEDIEVGMRFHAQGSEGSQVVTVVAVDDSKVTVDGNHPLAGMNLAFDVKVLEVREATAEELAHGHIHGEGDDHHH
jgi:FKBP-type peptidyl-prolyl cis-trans isomerase SlyD